MYKKILAIILMLATLCTCAMEKPTVPNVPEESSSFQEEQELTDFDYQKLRQLLEFPEEFNSTPCGYEGGNPYKASGIEVPKEIEELLFRMRRTGEFSGTEHIDNEKILYAVLMALPMVSKYDLEPELAQQLEPLFEEIGDECFYPAEWVEKAAVRIFGTARVNHKSLEEAGFVYHEKAGVYTPPHKGMESVFPYIINVTKSEVNGTDWTAYEVDFIYLSANNLSGYEIGDEGYFISCDIENGENIFDEPEFIEFIESGKDTYTARFVEQNGEYQVTNVIKNITVPNLIAKHIAILNELEKETFGMDVDWDSYFIRLYNEKPYGEGFELGTPPDALESASAFYGIAMGEEFKYKGYYVDLNCESVRPATNFSSKAEVFDYLCQWVSPEIIEQSSFDHHVMDFGGKVYLLRHSRGYGVSYYGDAEIIERTDSKMLARVKMCRIVNEEVGVAEVEFEKIDGNWIIVSVTENYYK